MWKQLPLHEQGKTIFSAAKYVTKKKRKTCHVPKDNQILGKFIKFRVNTISLSKVLTFLYERDDSSPLPDQIGLSSPLNAGNKATEFKVINRTATLEFIKLASLHKKLPADLVTFTEEILNGKLHFFVQCIRLEDCSWESLYFIMQV